MKKLWLVLIASLFIAAGVDAEQVPSKAVSESQNQLIKLTEQGPVPARLRMKVEDSIVFLLNDTSDSLATLEMDFHGKKTHCATANLKVDENQKVHSVRPYGPRDFASVCFHQKGEYPYTIYGLKRSPQGVSGVISVE